MSRMSVPSKSKTPVNHYYLTQIFTNNRGVILTGIALTAVFFLVLAAIQFTTPALAGTDGYYHIKMGWLIRQQGLKPDFIWLPQTILNSDAYYNHHFLYHIYLALFALGDPAVQGGASLIQGAKIASVLMPTLAFLMIWWLLRRRNVPHAWIWAVGLLAISEAFLYRMSMPRAQSASLLILALALHLLFEKRYRPLLALGFLYVWFYNAFPLLLLLIGAYVAAVFLRERRLEWQPMAWAAVGIGLGLIINPYFPENLTFIYNHLLPKLGESAVKVGNEWKPYQTWTLVENSGPALILAFLGCLALGWREKKIDVHTLTAFFLMAGFGLMLFQSRRFIEYFPPFVLIFSALATTPIVHQWQKALSKRVWLVPLGLVILLSFPLFDTFNRARESIGRSQDVTKYAAAARWLDDHESQTVHVFQTDWDDFTRLFFHNTNATYTLGLDPTYMELYDPDLYELWVDITRGRIEQPGQIIAERFGGEYVFTDLKHDNFLERAAADPNLIEIYRDRDAVIFEVIP